jgi:gamma-glutamylputrescine oxidase
MKKASFWLDTPYTPREALNQDLEVDVVIVGGGITGVSALYHASQLGFKTALVERGEIAGGAAGKNGGMIVEGMAVDLLESIELFGEQTSIDIWKSSEIARKIILDIVDKHKIDCELTSGGSLYISNTKEDDAWLESENKVRNNHGFSSKFLKPGEQFKSSPFSGSLFNPQDSGINPVKFLRSLAKICELSGAKIFENTEALALNANSITTKNGVIRAKYVISAVESSMKDADTVMVDSIGLMTEPLSSDVLSRLDWKYGEML